MKNLLIFSSLMLLSVACFAQTSARDRINLKSGKTIKCEIIAVDSVTMSIYHSSLGVKTNTPLYDVASYIWNGEVNAGLPLKIVNMPSVTSTLNDNVFVKGNNDDPAQMFKKFADQAQTGLGLMIGGGVLTATAWLVSSNANTQKTIAIAGTAISTIGLIVNLVSYSHVRKAGELMQIQDNVALNVGGDGVGLVLKF